jgi:hypothetical protein
MGGKEEALGRRGVGGARVRLSRKKGEYGMEPSLRNGNRNEGLLGHVEWGSGEDRVVVDGIL